MIKGSQSFMGLVFDEQGLHSSHGVWPVASLKRAEFVRDISTQPHRVGDGTGSVEGAVGGAVVGGVLFGAAGAVGGALVGSQEGDDFRRDVTSNQVHVVFETEDDSLTLWVPREHESEAHRFVEHVSKAMKA